MSKVGNIEKMFGNRFDIVATNATADMIINAKNKDLALIPSSLVITSPLDSDNQEIADKGTPSLLITDYEGNPMRLTYTIQPGDGLVVDYNNKDVIKMSIDQKTIKDNKINGELYVNPKALINETSDNILQVSSENTIVVNVSNICDGEKIVAVKNDIESNNEQLTINSYALVDNHYIVCNENESDSKSNLYKTQKLTLNLNNIVDNNTIIIKTDSTEEQNKILSVQAKQLTLADSKDAGVVKIDDSTIKMNKTTGQIHVETEQLRRIGPGGGVGVIWISSSSTAHVYGAQNGELKVKTGSLPRCKNANEQINDPLNNGYGVVKSDGVTISSKNGVISVNAENLSKPDGKKAGVVTVDAKTIKHDGGKLSVITSGLSKASNTSFGVVRIDGGTIVLNSAGAISSPKITTLESKCKELQNTISNMSFRINNLENNLMALTGQVLGYKTDSLKITYESSSRDYLGSAIYVTTKIRQLGNISWQSIFDKTIKLKYIANTPLKVQVVKLNGYGITLDYIESDDITIDNSASKHIEDGNTFKVNKSSEINLKFYFKGVDTSFIKDMLAASIQVQFRDVQTNMNIKSVQFDFYTQVENSGGAIAGVTSTVKQNVYLTEKEAYLGYSNVNPDMTI